MDSSCEQELTPPARGLKRVKNADKEDRGRFETELSAADLSCANDLFALEFFECGLHGSQGFVDLGE